MNKWQLATCALLVFSISMVIGSNNLSNQIEELQTTVDRQANAIKQLEKEKNVHDPDYSCHLDTLDIYVVENNDTIYIIRKK